VTDPAAVAELLAEQSRRSASRREMEVASARFSTVSAAVGALDEAALAQLLADDADAGAELLTLMARATDRQLRARARAAAARLVVPDAADGTGRTWRGSSRIGATRRAEGDLDVDGTVANVLEGDGRPEGPFCFRGWQRPARAVSLVVDASGSVTGQPLATALLTAGAVIGRLSTADELAVVAFWSRSVLLRAMTSTAARAAVLDALFDLRGGDTTNLGAALELTLAETASALAVRRDIVVLTDGLATTGTDPLEIASQAPACGARLHVLALSEEIDAVVACTALAAAGGGRMVSATTPTRACMAVAEVLGRGGSSGSVGSAS